MSINRRSFLSWSASSAALLAAPTLLVPRRARAATRAFGEVRHVIVLNARGGFRSHCTFNAVGRFRYNPFGAQAAAAGTQWTLGAACGAVGYDTSLGRVPAFADVTDDVAVLACVDSDPGGPPMVDHVQGQRLACTGKKDGDTGLLSLVGAHHPLYAAGFSADVLPPVEIVPSDMGLGAGEYGARRPLSLLGAQFGTGGGLAVQGGWQVEARRTLDDAFYARRSRAYRKRLQNWRSAKSSALTYAATLQDPLLDVIGAPDATDAGVSNAQLIEVLGDHDLIDIGDVQPLRSWGADVALAVRALAYGAPMVSVVRDIYDMHDVERDAYGARSQDLVRQLTGLRFLLQQMPHPDGGSYWDKTLVVTLSEFSRNNTFDESGFNSGNGSDHVTEDGGAARNQAIAVMGGVVTARGQQLGATDDAMNATDRVFSMQSLLSTLLDVLGLDGESHLGAAPIAELFS